MTHHDPHHDDEDDETSTPRSPAVPETLFRVMVEGLKGNVGDLARGSHALRLEMTPTQVMRLTQELSPAGIRALMLVLQHGYAPGMRIEIVGWGGPWLREHGMRKYESEKAAAELRDKGYIRAERMPGGSHLGKQMGIVPSGFVQDVEDVPGVPRRDGRPVTKSKPNKPRHLSGVQDTGDPGNRSDAGDGPVDNGDTRTPRNPAPPVPGSQDDEIVFPQVRALSRTPSNHYPQAPSSSGSTEEGLFFLPGPGQSLTRPDLTRFFTQPELVSAIATHWEVTVALVAREFAPQASRCAELVDWLADGQDPHPETRLAQIVVDLMKVPTVERFTVVAAHEAFLRSRGVKFRQTNPDDFLAAFVIAIITALDSARPIDSWGGWFGGGLKRETQFQGKVLASVLSILRRLLESPADLLPPPGAAVAAAETTYRAQDPSFTDRLRLAAQGTIWEDDVSFEKLLRNPGQQARLMVAFERRLKDGNG